MLRPSTGLLARAIDLYRRLGFVEEGRRAKGIKIEPEQYVDEVLMGRWP